MRLWLVCPLPVIPAKAGIQTKPEPRTAARWIPAFAGMTGLSADPAVGDGDRRGDGDKDAQ
jgi:hypothetical protein